MVPETKYFGVNSLDELILLTKNSIAKKADTLQFDVMPDPIKYIGKVVQYVGASDVSFTRSHFYYSNGIKWTEENVSSEQTTHIEMVTALPSWADSDPQVLYILKNTADITMNFYVKNPSVNGAWFTVEKSVSFTVVSSLPQWADADSSTIYFKANGNDLVGNDLVGYIKKTGTIDAWYTFGEKPQITIDPVLSATSENPVQNKVIYAAIQDADKKLRDGIEANANALGLLGTEVSGIHDDITANQTEIAAIKQNLLDTYATQRYVQDADKKLHDGIEANANALGLLGTEVSGIHDDITANQTEIATIKQNLSDTYATQRYVQDADKKLHYGIEANQTEIEAIKQNLLDTYATQRYVQDADKELHDGIEANQTEIATIKQKLLDTYVTLLTKENTGNKVTVVDATATDAQYPSAKAVYDALEGSATAYPRPDWTKTVDISAEQLSAGYIAPSDGMFVCTGVMPESDNGTRRIISVNGIAIVMGQRDAKNVFSYGNANCPVNKGDLIKSSTRDTWGAETRYFVPWK